MNSVKHTHPKISVSSCGLPKGGKGQSKTHKFAKTNEETTSEAMKKQTSDK